MAGAHFDDTGRARMVDVSGKPETLRIAKARGAVRMEMSTLDRVREGRLAKGDVMAVAELAGIMAAKRTVDLIPLCHPVGLDAVTVEISEDRSLPGLAVKAEARATGRTGVEMEAMTAAAIACLTLYDMLKAIDRGMSIVTVELIAKSGGKSGDWVR